MKGSHSYAIALVLVAGLALVLTAACGQEEPAPVASSPSATTSAIPTATASVTPAPGQTTPAVTWQWLREMEYRSWERAPGWDERRTTDSPHSEGKEIFIDPMIAATIGSGETEYPAGATIVKEGYDGSGDLAIIAAMQRLPGSGWFFAEYRVDGSVVVEGDDPALCTRCHRGDQDGVLAFALE
jgi:hypothetical protein